MMLSLFLYDFYHLYIFFGGMSVQIMLFTFMLRGAPSPQDPLGLWLLGHAGCVHADGWASGQAGAESTLTEAGSPQDPLGLQLWDPVGSSSC